MIQHYVDQEIQGNDVGPCATAEWLIESALLRHEASGVCIEFRNGRVIVDGVCSVDTIHSATELLAEVA